MKSRPRRGLQNICTRSNQATEAENPQRKFLRVASLELRKTLCNKVRAAAAERMVEADEQLIEIESEQARLLQAIRDCEQERSLPLHAPHVCGEAASPKPCGFTMKY